MSLVSLPSRPLLPVVGALALSALGCAVGADTGTAEAPFDDLSPGVEPVDADADGLRDDLEAFTDGYTVDAAGRDALRDVGLAMTAFLQAPADDADTIRAAAQDENEAIACAFLALGDAYTPIAKMEAIQLGADGVLEEWLAREAVLGGEIYTAIPASDRPAVCAARAAGGAR